MTELLKDDIPILDFIINELCKNGIYSSITAKDLGDKKVFGFGKKDTVGDLFLNETDNKEFERLASIINKSGKAKISEQLFESPLSISRNSETLHFQKLGGFKNEFKNQKKSLDWYKIIPICVAIIFGSLSAYQKYSYNSLNVKFENLKVENFSLKYELDSLKINLTDMRSKENLNKEK